jgi:7-cyano-7-deazaguanine synthase in queuosine biosynthesis
MITMVMLSGGIDSTYLLYWLLRETNDVIHAHHIHLLTDTKRHVAEAARCKQIVEYCRKEVRPFTYSESSIDHRGFPCHGYDLMAASLEAGMVASSFFMTTKKNIDQWTVGIAADDDIPPMRIRHANVCSEANCQEGKAPRLKIFPRLDVKDQAAYLPADLFSLTWSCRYPSIAELGAAEPCGKCKPCLRRASVEQLCGRSSGGSEMKDSKADVETHKANSIVSTSSQGAEEGEMDKLSKVPDQNATKDSGVQPLIVEWKLAGSDGVVSSTATDSCGGGSCGGKDAIFPNVDTSVFLIEGAPGA